jgi:di/tricarboxylate transporter
MTPLAIAALASITINPAVGWLCALLIVMGVSLTSRINVGILAIVLAWIVAVWVADMKPAAVFAAFPSSLFLTLLGVTLLFGAAEKNGTLKALTQRLVGACNGVSALMPIAFFLLASAVSGMGPGAVAATALVAPLAMATGSLARVPPVLMALMVANGANAGSLSPFSLVGVIVQTQFAKAALPIHPWQIFFPNFVAHALVAIGAYLLFGGLKLSRHKETDLGGETAPLARNHWLTLAVLAGWIVAVVGFKLDLGLSAFTAAAVLILAGLANDAETARAVPWSVILMVCGVSVLVEVGQKNGGVELFTQLLAKIATPGTVNGVIAFVTGVISTYSSTSGVVYPAFLPAVPSLVQQLGGGNPLEIAMSINVGAALVDVSPLSTLGALCIAAAAPLGADPRAMFRIMLIWGFSMCIVGAIFCQLFIGFFR